MEATRTSNSIKPINNKPELLPTSSPPEDVGQEVEELLKENASTSIRDPNGKVALHYCTENGDLALVEKIYEGDPCLLDHKDEEGYTPLTFAVIGGNQPAVDFLIGKGADVNNVDNEKHSLVHWATVCSHKSVLETLLSKGALVGVPDLHGSQALHYATQLCNTEEGVEILKLLLRHGADVNCVDFEQRTPLLWAASCGSQEAFVALVEAGADKKCVDKDQLTTIHCAASRGHGEMVELILKLTVDAQLDARDKNGCSPLFYAATLGYAECTKILLKHGAQPNFQDKKLRTAAHCAAARGQLTTLKLLWNYGASFDLENHRGDLPIHEAIQAGSREVAAFLLTINGTNVNVRNHFGRTPLHLASANGNLSLCKFLVDKGSTVDALMISKSDILTSLDIAERQRHDDVVNYLNSLKARKASALSQSTIEEFKNSIIVKVPEKKTTMLIESTVQTDNPPEKVDRCVEVEVHRVEPPVQEGVSKENVASLLRTTPTDENNLNKTENEKTTTKKKSKFRKSVSLNRHQRHHSGSEDEDEESQTGSEGEGEEENEKKSRRKHSNHHHHKSKKYTKQDRNADNSEAEIQPRMDNDKKHHKHKEHKNAIKTKSLENLKEYDSLSLPDSEISSSIKNEKQHSSKSGSNKTEKNHKRVSVSKSMNRQLSLISEEAADLPTSVKHGEKYRNDINADKMFEHNDFDQSYNEGQRQKTSLRRTANKETLTEPEDNFRMNILSNNFSKYPSDENYIGTIGLGGKPDAAKISVSQALMNGGGGGIGGGGDYSRGGGPSHHRSSESVHIIPPSNNARPTTFASPAISRSSSTTGLYRLHRNRLCEVYNRSFPNSVNRYVEEKRIFQELANLKRIQIQYGKVQENILVRRLMDDFLRQYNVELVGGYQVDTFHAWEQFLYEQLQRLYQKERETIRIKRLQPHSEASLFEKRLMETSFRNRSKVDALNKAYGVAPIPLQYAPNMARGRIK